MATLALAVASLPAGAAPGDLDPSFSRDGRATVRFLGYDAANAVAIDSKQRAIVAGRAADGTRQNFALARFTPDGRLDPTFSRDGKLMTDFGGEDHAIDVAVLPDDRIVAVGRGAGRGIAVAVYRPSGALDRRFSRDGKDLRRRGDEAIGVVPLPDGGFIVGGYALAKPGQRHRLIVLRYRRSGALHREFADNGIFDQQGDILPTGLAPDPNGRVVVTGIVPITLKTRGIALTRLTAAGAVDRSYGVAGTSIDDEHAIDDVLDVEGAERAKCWCSPPWPIRRGSSDILPTDGMILHSALGNRIPLGPAPRVADGSGQRKDRRCRQSAGGGVRARPVPSERQRGADVRA